PFHRWRLHGVVNQVGRRVRGIDDIAIVGNADHRRRQVDIEAADRTRIAIAVVDDDDLAALPIAPDPAQQLTVGADDGDDLAAVGTEHDGAGLAADLLGLDVARAKTETIELVVADERFAVGIADDDPAGFGDDGAAAYLAFVPLVAEIIEPARALRGGSRHDRRQRLGGRRCRQWRGDGRRCAAGKWRAARPGS